MAKKKYKVLSPVDHDKERYEIDETIELEDKDATGLLAVKAIEEIAAQAGNAADAPTDPAERLAAIVAAIGKLNPDDVSLWLKDKRPDAAAISVITGWPVSAAERNDAWASMQPAA